MEKEEMRAKTKPQIKQKLAEWLVKNVLGLEEQIDGLAEKNSSQKMYVLCNRYFRGEHRDSKMEAIKRFIYSPAGFFAVWDAVEDKYHSIEFWHVRPGKIGCGISSLDKSDPCYAGEGYGKDRYECFYNAVYEAMNENDDH